VNYRSCNRLFSDLVDNNISESDKGHLVGLLQANPEARKLYARNLAIESLLHWENSPTQEFEQGTHLLKGIRTRTNPF
jgi:hypothetical protein